jgi:SAM-dependent methyltransferase
VAIRWGIVSESDPDERRAANRDSWEEAAEGWGTAADKIRQWAGVVSAAMIDALDLQPGERVLELAAGPGDTGFMAAELIAPGGTLICSDVAEAMLDVARGRAAAQGIGNVEFRQLDLEFIDLPTADVDAVLCRWGLMFAVDPGAAASEIRRVLKPGGRAALAVWDLPQRNPWTTLPRQAMAGLGRLEAPEAGAPGMFSLAADGVLRELLEGAGLVDVQIVPVQIARHFPSVEAFLDATLEISTALRDVFDELDAPGREGVRVRLAGELIPYTGDDGQLTVPGTTLVAAASA